MNIQLPFEKDIIFKTKIQEITKISLEHDYNINDNVLLGNFYISGEYRPNSISVNIETFDITEPFEVHLGEDIKKETIEFNIEDFSYEIKDDKTLTIKIMYSLKGDKKEVSYERVEDSAIESELSYIDDFLDNKEGEDEIENRSEYQEEIKNDEKEKEIIETIKSTDDTFVTYKIHIVKDNETIESISNTLNVPINIIKEYNNVGSIEIGDKLLIPKIDE